VIKVRLIGLAVAAFACAAGAENQVWNDGGSDNVWSTNAANWDAGAVWTNGNSAVFSGAGGTVTGETVDVSATVTVANVTFQTNGYAVADANGDGTFTLVGGNNVIAVSNASDTALISTAIGGCGFTKTGNGVLQLAGANTFTGMLTVAQGTLKLSKYVSAALGATGTGNDTVVSNGATLDLCGAYTNSLNWPENLRISGTGVNGNGALINTGAWLLNSGLSGTMTLLGDTLVNCMNRIDFRGTVNGNGYTLTKNGGSELAVAVPVNNCAIIINAGQYTYMNASALGGTDYETVMNGGNLQSYGGAYTLAERITCNGGRFSTWGYTGNPSFNIAGHVTLNSNVEVRAGTDISYSVGTLELSGFFDGAGGLTRIAGQYTNYVYITGNTNTYTGPTIISSGASLWVGKTVGGTGKLGSGTVTNNGTLYANSPVLGTGEVVNNAGASLYLNSPLLDSGRIVNLGTVYGTSILQTAGGIVNSGTWHAYSGVLGSGVVTNSGALTVYTNLLTFGRLVNSGTLNVLQSMTWSNAVTFNGGTVAVSSNALLITGPVTVNGNTGFSSTSAGSVEISAMITGAGGFTQNGDGGLYLTCATNTYSGPTIIGSGKTLVVGKTPGATGSLGSGSITNWGTLYANSERLCSGSVVNYGTLYWNGGLLSGTGDIVNNSSLFIDRAGAFVCSNAFFGSGTTYLRYGAEMTVSGSVSSNAQFKIGTGTLTLTNGADFRVYQEMQVADKIKGDLFYSAEPTNVTVIINVSDGCTLTAQAITFGNGLMGTATGILNQAGGVVRTTGTAAEGNGIRLGHYPAAYSVYNMMGGTLVVEKDYDLSCATDGTGWFKMTGGQVFTTRVMLNERDAVGGSGRLTLSGGVLNVGSLSGNVAAISNAITADLYAPYLVEYGGAGGIVRAVTNLYLPLNATLYGTGTNAVTFDTSSFATYQSGNLSGTGGLNKSGSGTLVLSGTNTYAGGTRILEGTVQLAAGCAGPTGMVAFAVSTNGVGGVLAAAGDLSLAGMTVAVANPEALDKSCSYTVASWSGNLTSQFGMSALPWPWYVYYDWAGKTAQLRAAIGTVIRLR
jgi:autotransporter-associated beta strand protein